MEITRREAIAALTTSIAGATVGSAATQTEKWRVRGYAYGLNTGGAAMLVKVYLYNYPDKFISLSPNSSEGFRNLIDLLKHDWVWYSSEGTLYWESEKDMW